MAFSDVFKPLGDIVGWFSVEQRMKQKRIKRDALKEERVKLMKLKCNTSVIKKVMAIDEELKKIERDLGN